MIKMALKFLYFCSKIAKTAQLLEALPPCPSPQLPKLVTMLVYGTLDLHQYVQLGG